MEHKIYSEPTCWTKGTKYHTDIGVDNFIRAKMVLDRYKTYLLPKQTPSMIVFLDIDGVLVHTGCKLPWEMDPDCVTVLQEFCNKHNAKIVVSSAWRIGRSIAELEFSLFSYGLDKGLVIGKTDLGDFKGRRDDEILEWLDEYGYKGDYIVIDDEDFDLTKIDKKKIVHIKKGFTTGGMKRKHLMGL